MEPKAAGKAPTQAERPERRGFWPIPTTVILLSCVLGLGARLQFGAQADALLIPAAALAILLMGARLVWYANLVRDTQAEIPPVLYRQVLDSAGPAVLATDLQGRVFYVNAAFERLTGYDAAEVMEHWGEFPLLQPEDVAHLMEELERISGVKVPAPLNYAARLKVFTDFVQQLPPSRIPCIDLHAVKKNGTPIDVTLHVTALRDEKNNLTGLVAMAIDRTATIHRAQTNRETEDRFRDLAENAADLIATLSPSGRFLYANMAWKDVFKLDSKQMLEAAGFDELFAPHTNTDAASYFGKALQGLPVESAALRYKAADGTVHEFELSMSLRQVHGNPLAVRCLLHNITRRVAADRVKDEFIATVSHELRTPLTSIRGAIGLLASGMLGEVGDKASNLLRIALTNSDRLVRLINDILDLERLQSGRAPLNCRAMNLAEVIRQAVDGITPVADAASVRLLHDAVPVEIQADQDRLLQVFTNLLSNAVKFSPKDGAILVRAKATSDGISIAVVDEGRGIPTEMLESVFGRFKQVEAGDARQKGGTGLGLAICRSIVEQHGGRIWAERNPERGSTFQILLPFQLSRDPAIALDPSTSEEFAQPTVLLAGLPENARPQVIGQLERHGYQVVESSTLEETVLAFRHGVEAVLVDSSPGGINGWELLSLLRKLAPESKTPVVLLNVHAGTAAEPLAQSQSVESVDANSDDPLMEELNRALTNPGEQTRVLVVEDDQDLAGVIAQVFSRVSLLVEQAYTLEDAYRACEQFRPHLLVLDIALPDGDGFHLVEWLRQHSDLAQLPLVVYSGRDLNTTERKQLRLGPTQFLTKARVHPQQLEALVVSMIRQTQQTRG